MAVLSACLLTPATGAANKVETSTGIDPVEERRAAKGGKKRAQSQRNHLGQARRYEAFSLPFTGLHKAEFFLTAPAASFA